LDNNQDNFNYTDLPQKVLGGYFFDSHYMLSMHSLSETN